MIDEELIMFKSPTIYSKPIVFLKKGRLNKIIKCKEEWCKAKSDKYKGWLKRKVCGDDLIFYFLKPKIYLTRNTKLH